MAGRRRRDGGGEDHEGRVGLSGKTRHRLNEEWGVASGMQRGEEGRKAVEALVDRWLGEKRVNLVGIRTCTHIIYFSESIPGT